MNFIIMNKNIAFTFSWAFLEGRAWKLKKKENKLTRPRIVFFFYMSGRVVYNVIGHTVYKHTQVNQEDDNPPLNNQIS